MAASVLTPLRSKSTDDCIYPSWSLIGTPTSDTPTPVESPSYADRSVQVFGAVGAAGFNGATITMQGSNDGTNWFTLTDPLGNDVAFTASGGKQIMEVTRHIRPIISGATTGTAPGVTVNLLLRR